jgi:hypothetical protein
MVPNSYVNTLAINIEPFHMFAKMVIHGTKIVFFPVAGTDSPSLYPLLAYKRQVVSICSTEKRKTKREGREVVISWGERGRVSSIDSKNAGFSIYF